MTDEPTQNAPMERWLLEMVFEDGKSGLGLSVSDYTGSDDQFILNLAAHLEEMWSHRPHRIDIHRQNQIVLMAGDRIIERMGWGCLSSGACVIYSHGHEKRDPHEDDESVEVPS